MKIIQIDNENFNDLINKKVLVDFYAEWCGPCKMIGSELEKVESELSVVKVNVDNHEDLARTYGIMSIPTMILFENGQEIKRHVGFINKNKIEEFIK